VCLKNEHKIYIMKYYIILLFLGLSLSGFTQEVSKEGKIYEVKNEKIYLNGEDITETLSLEKKTLIFKEAAAISETMKSKAAAQKNVQLKKAESKTLKDAEKLKKEEEKALKKKEEVAKKLEKENKKAEKAQKKAEKERKKAEKEIKKKEKLQKNFEKAESNLNKAQNKYEKRNAKGKLSPVDERKWLDKIEKLTEKVAKAKRKL